MLPRVLEPEVMDTVEDAVDYDSMDHAEVNRRFVDDLLQQFPQATGPVRILDLGTGTALIPIELCRRPVSCHVVAVDLAVEMLLLAEQRVRRAGLHGHIQLEKADAKSLPFGPAGFDVVISNSIIHHIPEPLDCFREMQRVLRPGGALFVRDLVRLETAQEIEEVVARRAGTDTPRQQQLFRQSLHAALTVAEVRDLMDQLGFTCQVDQSSDRHWTLAGIR